MLDEKSQQAASLKNIHSLYAQLTPRHRVVIWAVWLLVLFTNKGFSQPFHHVDLLWRRMFHHVD